jgi:multiple sugar transport system permease protein
MHAAETAPAAPIQRGGHRVRIRAGYLFMVPAFAVLALFMLGPSLYALYSAFTDMALTGTGAASPQWVGWQNFDDIFHDAEFFNSVKTSLTYLVGSAIIGQAGLGLLLALLMQNRSALFKGAVGGIVIAAWVIPDVVAAFLWSAFLHQDGLLNSINALFGLPQHAWLNDRPMAAVIVANIWRGTAFSMLIFSAALAGIPNEIYEATDLLLITLQTLSDFTLVWVLTAGGPGYKTQLMTIYMYQQAFKFYQLGYGTAVSLLILIVGAILSLVYIRVLRVRF